ncbi:hypothetical protein CFP56_039793 [Quercus suber]|uniref:Uncharacterized protein n=1 Tax=Quercus suber TaxID=58331 RepID=A0AAW0MBU8_QUESU
MTVGFCGKRIYANVEWEFIVCGMSYLLVGEMLKWDDTCESLGLIKVLLNQCIVIATTSFNLIGFESV